MVICPVINLLFSVLFKNREHVNDLLLPYLFFNLGQQPPLVITDRVSGELIRQNVVGCGHQHNHRPGIPLRQFQQLSQPLIHQQLIVILRQMLFYQDNLRAR